MIYYLIQSTIALAVLLLIYMAFLNKKGHFKFSRFYLLIAVLFSLLVPCLQVQFAIPPSAITDRIIEINEQLVEISNSGNQELTLGIEKENTSNWSLTLIYSYLIITSLLLLRYVRNLVLLLGLIQIKGPIIKGMQSVLISKATKPFSFFKYLFIEKDDLSNIQNNESILLHEKAHYIQKHSIDVLLIELIQLVFWFNPILIAYKKAIRNNHEYLADAYATNKQNDSTNYLNNLLQFSKPTKANPLCSGFSYLNIKNRIKMIQKSKSNNMKKFTQITISIAAAIGILTICSFKPAEAKYKELNKVFSPTAIVDNTPSILPLEKDKISKITSHFGMRYNPIVKAKKMHSGIDFSAPKGTAILATADGTVGDASFDKGYGNHIKIKHNDTYKTLYAHLESMSVKKGQKVKKGDVIGYIGKSGKSLGIHLHYEVVKDDKQVDPIDYFQYTISVKE